MAKARKGKGKARRKSKSGRQRKTNSRRARKLARAKAEASVATTVVESAPRGEQAGLAFVLYMSFRFALEGVKEFQRFAVREPDPVTRVIHVLPTADVTMGQWLSVPFVAIGLFLLLRAYRRSPHDAATPGPTRT